MVRWAVIGVALLAALGGLAATDERLEDVAGSIRLRTPTGGTVLVDEVPADARGVPAPDGRRFVELAERFTDETDRLVGLLGEVRRSDAFYSRGWRERFSAAMADAEDAAGELAGHLPPPRYAAARALLLEAVASSTTAIDGMAAAVKADRPSFSPALAAADEARELATRGLELAAELRLIERLSEPPPVEDPIALRQRTTVLCRTRSGGNAAAEAACVAAQEAAASALEERFHFTAGVTEARFNAVRNGCRNAFPDDLVARDRCERIQLGGAASP